MYFVSYLEPVCCSMSSSNCCFLTCIQISQGAGQVVWYSHLFQNFPQFLVIHTVKAFGIVNKAEIDVFLELSCFFDDPADVGNLISGSSAFCKTSLNIWKFTDHVLLAWRILRITLLAYALLLSALSQTCYNLSQLKNQTKLKTFTSLSHTHSHSYFWSSLQSCLYSFQFLCLLLFPIISHYEEWKTHIQKVKR